MGIGGLKVLQGANRRYAPESEKIVKGRYKKLGAGPDLGLLFLEVHSQLGGGLAVLKHLEDGVFRLEGLARQ